MWPCIGHLWGTSWIRHFFSWDCRPGQLPSSWENWGGLLTRIFYRPHCMPTHILIHRLLFDSKYLHSLVGNGWVGQSCYKPSTLRISFLKTGVRELPVCWNCCLSSKGAVCFDNVYCYTAAIPFFPMQISSAFKIARKPEHPVIWSLVTFRQYRFLYIDKNIKFRNQPSCSYSNSVLFDWLIQGNFPMKGRPLALKIVIDSPITRPTEHTKPL